MKQNDQPLENDFINRLNQVSQLLNRLRSEGLSEVNNLTTADVHQLDLELELEVEKSGEDSPSAQNLKVQISAQRLFRTRLQAAGQRAQIEVPKPKPDCLIIHGRVVDKDSLGISGVTISGMDIATSSTIRYECTDQNGYFNLEIPCEHRRPNDERSGRDRVHESNSDSGQVFLRISDWNQSVLFTSEETFVLDCGSVIYQEIELDDERAAACRPPP